MSTRWTVVAASCATFATSIWLISPRFAIGGPSLIDDWTDQARSPHQVSSVTRLFSVYVYRFRPGWIAWNYLQWHTFGAPAQMLGPNVWGVVRLLTFVVGVAWLSFLLLRRRLESTSRTLVWTVLTIVPLLVLTTPNVAVEYARFGPQEPLLIGCMALGASFLILGRQALITGSPRTRRAWACLVAGSALWVVGVYQKEISVIVIVFFPFLYLAYRPRIRGVLRQLDQRGRITVGALSAVVLLPIAHVALEVARIADRGTLVYGAQVRSGGGVARKTVDFIKNMSTNTGSHIGWLLLGVLAVQVATSMVRRRPDWLLTGLLVTAIASLVWNAQTGQPAARFYIPALTLAAMGSSLGLLQLRDRAVTVVLVVVAALIGVTGEQFRIWSSRPGPELSHVAILVVVASFISVGVLLARRGHRTEVLALVAILVLLCGSALTAHRAVGRWARDDEHGWQLVTTVSSARNTGCPVAQAGLDLERAEALPVLLALRPAATPSARCNGRAFLVVGPGGNRAAATGCRAGTSKTLSNWILQGEPIRLVRCTPSRTPEAARLFAHSLG